jgi:hypothetical protein
LLSEADPVNAPIELETDPILALGSIASLVRENRRSLAEALCGLRKLVASHDPPEHVRSALAQNVRAFRRAVSVRHRALWLSTVGDFPEAILILDVAKSILCCESAPCRIREVDAWLPVHARTLELLDRTRDHIVRRWRAA